jgi:hypothetical protein
MQDLETLRTRVDRTADKLATAETERRDQTSSLVNMLQRLEEKYTSQEVELNYYRQRIQPMEVANGELARLMDKLLDLIDAGFDQGSMGSLQDAAKLATDMLGANLSQSAVEEVQEAPAVAEAVAEEVVVATTEDIIGEGAEEPVEEPVEDADEDADDGTVEDADDGTVVQLEDVSDAVLALELVEDAPNGMDDYPAIIRVAADMAADDGLVTATDELAPDIEMSVVAEKIAAAVNADTSLLTLGTAETDDDSENDIKALLARVEALAAKAELMREPEFEILSAGSDEPIDLGDFDEAPRRAGSAF